MAVASAGRARAAREFVMVVKVGGSNPYAGQVMTTMGYRAPGPPLCQVCGGHVEGIYTINGNGQQVGPCCQSPRDLAALRGPSEPEEVSDGGEADA